jgi:hypothetical protein
MTIYKMNIIKFNRSFKHKWEKQLWKLKCLTYNNPPKTHNIEKIGELRNEIYNYDIFNKQFEELETSLHNIKQEIFKIKKDMEEDDIKYIRFDGYIQNILSTSMNKIFFNFNDKIFVKYNKNDLNDYDYSDLNCVKFCYPINRFEVNSPYDAYKIKYYYKFKCTSYK